MRDECAAGALSTSSSGKMVLDLRYCRGDRGDAGRSPSQIRMTARMTVSVGSMLELQKGESMSGTRAPDMLGGGRRAASGTVTQRVDAFRRVAGRAGSRREDRSSLLMTTGSRVRPAGYRAASGVQRTSVAIPMFMPGSPETGGLPQLATMFCKKNADSARM